MICMIIDNYNKFYPTTATRTAFSCSYGTMRCVQTDYGTDKLRRLTAPMQKAAMAEICYIDCACILLDASLLLPTES